MTNRDKQELQSLATHLGKLAEEKYQDMVGRLQVEKAKEGDPYWHSEISTLAYEYAFLAQGRETITRILAQEAADELENKKSTKDTT